jgi:hypothetical protein
VFDATVFNFSITEGSSSGTSILQQWFDDGFDHQNSVIERLLSLKNVN